MNNKKVCFITCVNDDLLYNHCLNYINKLNVPDGYELEILSLENSSSITNAYNKAINLSHAKYKIYLHQDTYIINENFIKDILEIFESNLDIGMLGVVGCKALSMDGIWWNSPSTVGKVIEIHTGILGLLQFREVEDIEYVDSIDGLIMITQYDIKWREDLFDGWHFYDTSQCMEFKRKGYKVGVPKQFYPWCIHDCGIVDTSNGYEEYRSIFLKEYLKYC